MTKKDYELIAQAFRAVTDVLDVSDDEYRGVREVAVAIALRLADNNPRFDRARFLAACGVEEEA